VVDASVAIAWYLEQAQSNAARHALESLLLGRKDFVAPSLFHCEVVSGCVRKHPSPGRWLASDAPRLFRLPLAIMAFDESWLPRLGPFVEAELSGYDGSYAALAQALGARWLTFDDRASRRSNEPDWIVHDPLLI